MQITSDLGLVHKVFRQGESAYVLACNPSMLIGETSRWYGAWRSTTEAPTCSKCIKIPDKPEFISDEANMEFAISRAKGRLLIPVKNRQTGENVLLNHEPGWGTLVFRWVTDWHPADDGGSQ